MQDKKITNIAIYPVKSFKGIDLQQSEVTSRGLLHDRRYMVVDSDSRLVTQREHPEIATISAAISDSGISLNSPQTGAIEWAHGDVENEETREVTVWNNRVEAVFAKKEINDWLSEILVNHVSLVYMPDHSRRPINELFDQGDEIVSFADGYPLLAINESSFGELNERLDSPVKMDRFRPNLVIEGFDAFEEDNWKRIKIGECVFRITKPCARCTVTTIDQESGIPMGKEPLRTLASFRTAKNVFAGDAYQMLGLGQNDVLFGTNLVPEKGKNIKIGDPVEVLG